MLSLSTFGFGSWSEANAYVTFVAMGMTTTIVLNAITSAPAFVTEYYMYATGNPDADAENPSFWTNANTFYNVGSFGVQLIVQPLALIPAVRRIPLRQRLFVGLSVPVLEMFLVMVMPFAKLPTQEGAVVVLIVVALLGGVSKGLCNACAYALAGPFPTKFINGLQWGLTVSAVLMSLLQVVLKAAMGTGFDSVLTQSRIYFGVGIAITLFTIFEFAIMPRNKFVQQYVADFRVAAQKVGTTEPTSGDPSLDAGEAPAAVESFGTPEEQLGDAGSDEKKEVSPTTGVVPDSQGGGAGASAAVLNATGDADKMVDTDQTGQLTSSDQMMRASVLHVALKVWPMLLSAFLVFFMSMMVFPGVFFSVDSDDSWYTTIIVLLFNVGDFLSRIVLMIPMLRPSPLFVFIGTLVRIVAIVPLLVLCQRHIIPGHVLPYILITVTGLTNGYFGAMAGNYCPRTPSLETAGERALAGILSSIAILVGLVGGSTIAIPINLTE